MRAHPRTCPGLHPGRASLSTCGLCQLAPSDPAPPAFLRRSISIWTNVTIQNRRMCLGADPNKAQKRAEAAATSARQSHEGNNDPHYYSRIFNEIETQMILHRTLLMQRLVHDPFYIAMNVSTASRLWMLRTLAQLAELVEQRYHLNMLQFFEFIGRNEMLKFLRYKNAPPEMVALWEKLHPLPPPNFPAAGPGPSGPSANPAPAEASPRSCPAEQGDSPVPKKRRA